MTVKKQQKPSAGPALPNVEAAAGYAPFSQKELRELSFEISARWFSVEPAPRLTLSVVHPWRLHAYWRITGKMMQDATKRAAEPHALVLRFFDVTPQQAGEPAGTTFDIEVEGLDNGWYVDVWQPGRRYVAELGLRSGNQSLQVFARSNEIQVPPAQPSTFLAFDLGQYKGAKPVADAPRPDRSSYAVAHLVDLLPGFRAFPDIPQDIHPDGATQSLDEPDFPTAPLARQAGWDAPYTPDEVSAAEPERPVFGTDFPTISAASPRRADRTNSTRAGQAAGLPQVDYQALPPLPETDPQTVSDSSAITASSALPEPVETQTPGGHAVRKPAAEADAGMPPTEKRFPEVRATSRDRDTATAVPAGATLAPASAAPSSEYFDQQPLQQATAAPVLADARPAHAIEDQVQSPLNGLEATEIAVGHQAPYGPASVPVVALEEALAASYFSGAASDTDLQLSVQVQLSGSCRSDRVLTLFGETVDIDDQGRYSVRLELQKGPQLAAFLRSQRKDRQERH